jgi:hypothetical protein
LCLHNCHVITEVGVIAIAENCKNLTEINFESCWYVTEIGIVAIADNCFKFENISLYSNQNLTDRSLIAMYKNCSNLKKLDLCECKYFTRQIEKHHFEKIIVEIFFI